MTQSTALLDSGSIFSQITSGPPLEESSSAFSPVPGSVQAASSSIEALDRSREKRPLRHEGRVTPIRRLRGILQTIEGDKAIVLFVTNQGTYRYALPFALLEGAGVNTESQPFEYTEVERLLGSGQVKRDTKIVPLAPSESARKVDVLAGTDYQEKANRLREKFGA
jgi:hypothetical protein